MRFRLIWVTLLGACVAQDSPQAQQPAPLPPANSRPSPHAHPTHVGPSTPAAPPVDATASSAPPAPVKAPAIGSPTELALVAEINLLRENPRAYAAKLRAQRRFYNGKRIEVPGKITVLTVEGLRAVDEAIAVLERTPPRPKLRNEVGLHRAAASHAEEIGRLGSLAHRGQDGSTPLTRIQRYGQVQGLSGENLDFGSNQAEAVLIHLLVDDGVPNRGHRINLLEPKYTTVGVACRPHKVYRWTCAMSLAEAYRSF